MIADACRRNTLAVASAYARATGSDLSAVSRRFYGNSSFLRDFRAGNQSTSIDKLDEFFAKIRREWPEGAEWPFLAPVVFPRPKRGGKNIPK